ncbi:receptor-binding cancer antigen expressed on SiSo cells [Musca domestica]|uniref:Receptor-binding cancer antigen expressed on SiSo cells n=1 Tax=Musca domestica TaxID=7370 RepID=A0A1I8M7U0_MUSDO|nr:receptor-binding cancer antigen expressed on SiSo cells [Musca domestica]
MVFQQIKILFLSIFGLFRRALCCFSRKRKPSYSEPMNNVVVIQSNYAPPPISTNISTAPPERDWNSWDDSPRSVQEHIEQYRQQIAKPPTPQAEVNEPDFFKELTPVIRPQPKYYLADNTQDQQDFSRLQAAKTDVPIALNADLEDWEDEDTGDWEEMDNEQTKQLIREKRREMRNMRQKSLKYKQMANNIPANDLNPSKVVS